MQCLVDKCLQHLQGHVCLPAAQKDHVILGTDNYFKCSQTKWDQHIGERPPRTRGVPGMRSAVFVQLSRIKSEHKDFLLEVTKVYQIQY